MFIVSFNPAISLFGPFLCVFSGVLPCASSLCFPSLFVEQCGVKPLGQSSCLIFHCLLYQPYAKGSLGATRSTYPAPPPHVLYSSWIWIDIVSTKWGKKCIVNEVAFSMRTRVFKCAFVDIKSLDQMESRYCSCFWMNAFHCNHTFSH